VLASTPEAVDTALRRKPIFDVEIAYANRKPKNIDNAAETIESCELNMNPSR
jgi:hypothetical protein